MESTNSKKLRAELKDNLNLAAQEPIEQPDFNYGLVTILTEAANEIDGIRDKLESGDD